MYQNEFFSPSLKLKTIKEGDDPGFSESFLMPFNAMWYAVKQQQEVTLI